MSVAWVAVGSTAISAYSAYSSGKAQEKAANQSTQAQKEISDQSLALQKELADQQRSDLAPWRDVGETALQQVQQGINDGSFDVGNIDVTADPSYQFRLSEGLKALDNASSASGTARSGAQDKAIQRYAQNYASTEYANAYARELEAKNRKYNMLSGLSTLGQNAAAGQAGATGQLASTSANILSNQAATASNNALNAGNAVASGYSGVAAATNQGVQNWITYDALKNNTLGK